MISLLFKAMILTHRLSHFFLYLTYVSAFSLKIPLLTPREPLILRDPNEIVTTPTISENLKTYFYNQTLDHFNYAPISYVTFQQRYMVDSTQWGGAISSSPIFAYLGAEAPIDEDIKFIGFLKETAPHFKALCVYIEHRFYGKSVPFGPIEEVLKNATIRGYFSSAQAIADYAEILIHIKEKYSAQNSPIIVVGGSYGGMLASWFRLKYPHVTLGALASSAPILYFDDITPQDGYYKVVTRDFKEVSERCYQTIHKSWSEIDKVASQSNGLSVLSQRFNTCSKLSSSDGLKEFLEVMYAVAAQYDQPPNYPVTMVCKGIDGAPKGTDIIGRIFAGIISYKGNRTCYDIDVYNQPKDTSHGWLWQTCSEMMLPIGSSNDTIFPATPFIMKDYISYCKGLYGVSPRPHWVTTYYGGHDIKKVLHRFASNIIFSNDLRDPYSSGGVLDDISDNVLAITTTNGSHCLDILNSVNTDPKWLVMQRHTEIKIIDGWLAKYYAGLKVTY